MDGGMVFKLQALLSSKVAEHIRHKFLASRCQVLVTTFTDSNACFRGLVLFLNNENLRATFII